MDTEFKDYFSDATKEYSKYRPTYPKELFFYLATLTKSHERAWDCATGSAQAAMHLTKHYKEVIASDASKTQIDSAVKTKGIIYKVARAEKSGLGDSVADLITVAQSLHWFNIDAFITEVSRVLKQDGIIALWTYNLLYTKQEAIDKAINYLYYEVLKGFWPVERKMVEDGYNGIEFPFDRIKAESFAMRQDWILSDLIGYLCTWSAVKKYKKELGTNPIDKVYASLLGGWGDSARVLRMNWHLSLKIWRKGK